MFGVVNDGNTGAPVDYHISSLWEALTGQRTENMQNLKATLVHHLAIRIFIKFLSYTLNSRATADKSNSKDLEILGSLLRPEDMPRMNYVYCLKRAFAYYTRDVNIDRKQDITIGGLVSHIAACLNLGLNPPDSFHDSLITKDHLARSKWLDEVNGQICWRINDSRRFTLPRPLLSVGANLASYLCPYTSASSTNAPVRPTRRPPVETAPIPPHPSTVDLLESMNRLHVGINQMRHESAERGYHAVERDFEQQRGMYPIYD